jgi:hypothetical protein
VKGCLGCRSPELRASGAVGLRWQAAFGSSDSVSGFLQGEGAVVLDLTAVAESLPLSERVVNHVDAHPGEVMHARVAKTVEGLPVWKEVVR